MVGMVAVAAGRLLSAYPVVSLCVGWLYCTVFIGSVPCPGR